jgi:methyl-accepting chemotaxis protein
MSMLNNLQIRLKLVGGFGLAGLLLLFGTLMGYVLSQIISTDLHRLNDKQLSISQQSFNLTYYSARIENDATDILRGNSSTSTDLSQYITKVDQILKELKKTSTAVSLSRMDSAWQAVKTSLAPLLSSSQPEVGTAYPQNWQTFLAAVEIWQGETVTQANADTDAGVANATRLSTAMLAGGAVGILASLLLGAVLSANISTPLKMVVDHMEQLSMGALQSQAAGLVGRQVASRKDELGLLGKALQQVEAYLDDAASTAHQIANGNLAMEIDPRSDEDRLGTAMAQMVQDLNRLVSEVASSSQEVGAAAQQLSSTAEQTSQGTAQISATIQQVAQGINQQSSELGKTISSVQQTAQTIEDVSQGALEQKQAVNQTNQIASQMNAAIKDAIQSIKAVTEVSDHSSKKAGEGAAIVRQAISSIDGIQIQVGRLDEKMGVTGERSGEIGSIVETIEDIATKTNILAINATIEAAHAKTQVKLLTEAILNQMMVNQCQIVARILGFDHTGMTQEFWTQLGKDVSLDTILITDADGVVTICNEPGLVNWRFEDDPKSQTYPFRLLINQKNGVYCQESQPRALDHQVFKYVGISRTDQPGIVQVGYKMEFLQQFDVRIEGFAVVAEEVYKLSEQSHSATREIRQLISGIRSSIREASQAMDISRDGVKTSKQQADQASQVLEAILGAVQDVTNQAKKVLGVTQRIQELAQTLNSTVSTVSRVVEQNTVAAAAIDVSYTQVANTVENIASMSQQNSAAAQEVSASAVEMRSQMEQVKNSAQSLAGLALSLEQAVEQFHLN